MKTGFRKHLSSGILMLAVVQFFVFVMYKELFMNLYYLIFSSIFFILGAVLPDIDSKSSIPHRHFKRIYYALSAVMCFSLGYFILSYLGYQSDFYLIITNLFASLAISYIAVAVSVRKLRHRGFLHSVGMAVFYGTAVFLIFYFLQFEIIIAFATGFLAMYGWYFHKVIDKMGDKLKWYH